VLLLGTGPAVWQVDDALPGVDAGQPAPGLDAAMQAPDADEILDEDAATSGDAMIHAAADAGSHPVARDASATEPGQVSTGCGCLSSSGGQPPLGALLLVALVLLKAKRRAQGGA
jgi:MYXO-CTERM domain-containing protein